MADDITARVALEDAKFLRGLDRLEKRTEGFGKRVDKAVSLFAGGFVGVKVFNFLTDAVHEAAQANEDYAATWNLIESQVKSTKVAIGSGLFDAFTSVGDFFTGGALTERNDAARTEALSIADAKKTADAAKAAQDKKRDAAEKAAQAAEKEAEQRDAIIAAAMREADEEEYLAGVSEDRLEVERERVSLARQYAEIDKATANSTGADRVEALTAFNEVAERKIAVLEAKRKKSMDEAQRAAKDRYAVEVASLEIQRMRAQGDERAADAAEALLKAEESIKEINERAGLSATQRADLIARTRALADDEVAAIARGDGGGRGSGPSGLSGGAGTAGRGSILAQTFGSMTAQPVRDLVALQKAANHALESIKNDIGAIRKGGGGSATFK